MQINYSADNNFASIIVLVKESEIKDNVLVINGVDVGKHNMQKSFDLARCNSRNFNIEIIKVKD
ncbi:MAG: hypothetical protein J6J36_06780 [Clostridia bacterium]|nr:hypothetical protein [Clostridia bacterium]